MRLEILGPTRVSAAGYNTVLRGGLERSLLASLLLEANRTVPVDRLVDTLWEGQAPRNPREQLHSCVSRLRRRLSRGGFPDSVIVTDPDGYRSQVTVEMVDLLEFRATVAAARVAARAGRAAEARDEYRVALALWRGPALAGVDRAAVQLAAAGLEEERAQTYVECIEQELALGGGPALVGELTTLLHRYPYQEKLHGALILALYRSDRQAEALAAYQRVRQLLVAELGQEPGPALRELHQRILTGDDSLLARIARPEEADPVSGAARHCLPRTVDDFTGRERDLSWLLKLAREGDPYASPVLAIDGMPGVGKTTLAVRAAHLLEPSFPDGQLFVDLQGHSDDPPLDPSSALNVLLGQLGVPAGQIPPDLDQRVARWRTELATRRVLLVLDNAASGAQLGLLLPAGGGCLTLVTSRHRLLDLDGAHPRSVETLSPEESVAMLERIAGARVRAEPADAAEVAKRCGYLPLALRLAATRLAHRSQWQVRDLASRLADPEAPLVELSSGERTLVSVFSLSYRQLPSDAQRTLRMLGLHPADTFDLRSVAAVADLPLATARRVVDVLVDAHLVEEPQPARYRQHDLVRAFASSAARAVDPEPDRRAATARLLDFYLHAAVAASTSLDSQLSRRLLHRDLTLDPPARPDLLERAGEQGASWFEAERPALLAAVRCAAVQGHWRHTWQLARSAWRFLYRRGYLADLIDAHRHGLTAAERLGDADAVAAMQNCLASAYLRTGSYDQAIEHLRTALQHRLTVGDQTGEVRDRTNLAITYADAGRYHAAVTEFRRAAVLARRLADRELLAMTVVNGGYIFMICGQLPEALWHSRSGMLLAREVGDQQVGAIATGTIGTIRSRLGHHGPAARLLHAGLLAIHRTSDKSMEAETLNELAIIDRVRGDHTSAVTRHRQALRLARETGFRQIECAGYRELGRTMHAAGDPTAGLELHRRSLETSRRIGYRYGQAGALAGIAECLRDTDPAAARRHWQHALRILLELDHPDQHQVERRLAALPAEP